MDVFLVTLYWETGQGSDSKLEGIYASQELADAVCKRYEGSGNAAFAERHPVLTEDLHKRASEIVKEARRVIAAHTRQ